MYEQRELRPRMIYDSLLLLKNKHNFYAAAHDMVNHWRYSAEHQLTDLTRNRRSWIGHAACCFKHKATMDETISAWQQLTKEEQRIANSVADTVINEFEQKRKPSCLKLDLG